MDLGIIGLPASGKTTLWRALTGGTATGSGSGRLEASIGVVHVPDERVDRLAELYDAKKITHAEIRWFDYPVAAVAARGAETAMLGEMARMDALAPVVGAFSGGGVADARRDLETLELELTFADLALIERRRGRIEPEIRSMRAGDRGPLEAELELLERITQELEAGKGLRAQELTEADRKRLSGYQLLTRRPLLVVVNVAEDDVGRAEAIEAEFAQHLDASATTVVALCAQLEAEVAALDPAEAAEFRGELGLPAVSPVARLVREAYALLGVHSFLTAGRPESRAWTLPVGGTALDAAGRIHSDIARGFIRAEVARYDELIEAGSLAELRKQGRLRTEGRDYVIEDGDVIEVLFNV